MSDLTPFNPFAEIKAGKRHSASDEALLKSMAGAMKAYTKAHGEHVGAMMDHLKALGYAEDEADVENEGSATEVENEDVPDSEVKALDYATLADLVEDAILEALDDMGGADDGNPMVEAIDAVMDDADDDDEPYVLVYPGYAVLCLGGADWRVPWRIEAGAVVLDTPDAWTRVEKEWKPVQGAPAGLTSDAVKLLDDGTLVAQAVRFGSPNEPDMSPMQDFFTKSTDFWLGQWDKRPMLYHHAMDAGTADAPVIGEWTKAWADDEGVWLQGQLDRAYKYHNAIKELARRGLLRVSTDSAPHLVRRQRLENGTHYVKTWPILAASLTVSPAEPRLLPAELKAELAALGVTIDSLEATDTDPRERRDSAEAGEADAQRLMLELDLLTLETHPL